MRSQSKCVIPPPHMKNIHGGPAVNPCTQGPEFGATPMAFIETSSHHRFKKKTLEGFEIFKDFHDFSKIADLQARSAALGAAL